ncbi:MAG TPA: Holliday junction resolvase RuvX [Thermoanaerobaculia bacterium]|nr:Holliday junction resolvase RuvX [Thermoanaerobaculia bacterium]
MAILCVDYGRRRIGIALSESALLATPHSVMPNPGGVEESATAIAALGASLGAQCYVVGLPRRSRSGSADRGLDPYRALAELLRQKTRKEVILWDEALSTSEALSRRREAGSPRRRMGIKGIDMEAAAVILQSYLDENPQESR